MIVTDRFVYLHLHKSGGTFVNECLLRFFPAAKRLGYHLPRSLIPKQLSALPMLGFVRNPWAYYVSWYAFQSQRAQPNALFRVVSENGKRDFSGTIGNLLALASNDAMLDRVLDDLPREYVNRGLNLPAFALEPIRGSGLGFYSYLYRYMYGEPDPSLFVGRTESLRTDLLHFLTRIGVEVSAPMRQFVLEQGPRNTSSHGAWREQYSAALAAEVASRDRHVTERFDYRFEP